MDGVSPPGGDWAEWIGLSNLQLCLSDPQVICNRCYSEVVPLLEEKFPTILFILPDVQGKITSLFCRGGLLLNISYNNSVWAKKWVNSRKEETPIHPANIEEFVLSSLLA